MISKTKTLNLMSDAGVAQLVECKLPKLDAAGSIPVARSIFQKASSTEPTLITSPAL